MEGGGGGGGGGGVDLHLFVAGPMVACVVVTLISAPCRGLSQTSLLTLLGPMYSHQTNDEYDVIGRRGSGFGDANITMPRAWGTSKV